MYSKYFRQFIIGFFILVISAINAQSINFQWKTEQLWMEDQNTGCEVYISLWKDLSSELISVAWEGECEGGKANGNGTLYFYQEDILVWLTEFKGVNGLIMVEGVPVSTVEIADFAFDGIVRCRNYSEVFVTVNPDIDLSQFLVFEEAAKKGLEYFLETCPTYSGETISIKIFPNNVERKEAEYRGEKVLREPANRVYGLAHVAASIGRVDVIAFNRGNLESYTTDKIKAIQQAEKDRQRAIEEEERRLIAEKQAVEQAAIKAEIETKNNAQKEIVQDLFQKAKVTDFPTMQQLYANPFIFEDKVIAIPLRFERMIAADEAVFYDSVSGNQALVTNIPTTEFTQSGINVIFIGKVAGSTSGGSPIFEFGAAHICGEFNCFDIFPSQ